MERDAESAIVLVTNEDVLSERAAIRTELTGEEMARVRFLRRDLTLCRTWQDFRIRGAKHVFLLGDENAPGRDAVVLKVQKLIAEKAMLESPKEPADMIPVYLHFEDPEINAQLRMRQLAIDEARNETGELLFDVNLFNYYESWVWECWSEQGSADGREKYEPLLFRKGTSRVALFVLGEGKICKPIFDAATTLMNYGIDGKNGQITLCGQKNRTFLPSEETLCSLPEVEVSCRSLYEGGHSVYEEIESVAKREDTSVTVIIVGLSHDHTLRSYLTLPFSIRSLDVSVLLWMPTETRNLPDKSLVKFEGDNTRLRYFGMLDVLPWLDSDRMQGGAAINYYYSVHQQLPEGTDPQFLAAAEKIWNGNTADEEWAKIPRWKKWSSLSSCDSFKEKSAYLAGKTLSGVELLQLLKAEHNRWWTERLLAEWRPGPRDNVRRIHPNLIPFEQLDDATKDIDKICIAAMAHGEWLC